MTGYTVHTGATEKFVAGWDGIFKKQAKAKGAPPKKQVPAKKKAATKVAKSKGRKAGKKKK
jgi:hypothetical protein